MFVMDGWARRCWAHIYQEADAQELADGTVLVQRRQAVNDWREMDNYWTIIEGDERAHVPSAPLALFGLGIETDAVGRGFCVGDAARGL